MKQSRPCLLNFSHPGIEIGRVPEPLSAIIMPPNKRASLAQLDKRIRTAFNRDGQMQNVLEKELLMTRRAFNYNSKEGSEEEESSLVAAALE
ncbi:hypothetical protein VNO78_35219 [Psophocarpus tetragonolobus]|uniref:Uncharacterized protein n=1 Tax=Psophocarpus tetragonolobus TaxID=3891 RepID=A0AAN9RLD5_PSOTE